MQSTLRTDTSVFRRMKMLQSQVTKLFDTNEREFLSNGIAEIADAYRDDWSSGSDEDADEL